MLADSFVWWSARRVTQTFAGRWELALTRRNTVVRTQLSLRVVLQYIVAPFDSPSRPTNLREIVAAMTKASAVKATSRNMWNGPILNGVA